MHPSNQKQRIWKSLSRRTICSRFVVLVLSFLALSCLGHLLVAPWPTFAQESDLPATPAVQPAVTTSASQVNQQTIAADRPETPADITNLGQQLNEIEPLLPSFYLGMQLFPTLPKLIGIQSPQRYLLVVQNSDELRATGGFISALGLLTLDKGRLADLAFIDSYRLYRADEEYPPAPAPMREFMGIPYLLFRDANWSPDFPTTAKLLQAIYRQETGVAVDGIVTVDLHAVETVVGALAPLRMPNVAEPLTGANVLTQIKALWAQPEAGETITDVGLGQWWNQRKNFIPTLAAAVVAKLQSGEIDYVAVALAVEQALNERGIQIWLTDETAATQLAALGWDGGLKVMPATDYLGLIDTNMGYNKVNAVIQRSLQYTVSWPADATAPPEALVTIDYRHPLTITDHTCDLTPRYGTDYEDLTERCFYNYVRLYVPGGSTLLEATGLQSSSMRATRGEAGTQVFSGYFVIPPGESQQVTFRYQLPLQLAEILAPDRYTLLVQRQAGSGALPLTLAIGDAHTSLLLEENTFYWNGR